MRPSTFIHANSSQSGHWVSIVALTFLVLFSACKSNRVNGDQGISGQVTFVSGNQMPPADASTEKGVERTIIIHEATKLSQVTGRPPLFDHISTSLITTTKTNADGQFQQPLPPGKYSIFVKEGEQFYANQFNTDNFIQIIVVKPNTWETIEISINYSASY